MNNSVYHMYYRSPNFMSVNVYAPTIENTSSTIGSTHYVTHDVKHNWFILYYKSDKTFLWIIILLFASIKYEMMRYVTLSLRHLSCDMTAFNYSILFIPGWWSRWLCSSQCQFSLAIHQHLWNLFLYQYKMFY